MLDECKVAKTCTLVCKGLLTLFALGVNGNNSEAGDAEEFSLSRMLVSKGLKKQVRLARGVELSTADMRAAFALRLTTDGLMLRRSVWLDAFLGLGPVPVLLALGPAGRQKVRDQQEGTCKQQPVDTSKQTKHCSDRNPPGMFLSRRGYRGEACAAGCAQSMATVLWELSVISAGCLRADIRLRLA